MSFIVWDLVILSKTDTGKSASKHKINNNRPCFCFLVNLAFFKNSSRSNFSPSLLDFDNLLSRFINGLLSISPSLFIALSNSEMNSSASSISLLAGLLLRKDAWYLSSNASTLIASWLLFLLCLLDTFGLPRGLPRGLALGLGLGLKCILVPPVFGLWLNLDLFSLLLFK